MMQDRFRFRAWNKEEKEYYYDAEKTYDYFNGIMSESFGELLENDRYIVEQCTGIRDKNGVLIYEGDLIRYVSFTANVYECIVKWYDCDGTASGDWRAVDYENKVNRLPENHFFNSYWEVYGNVHEKEIEMSKWKPKQNQYYYCINAALVDIDALMWSDSDKDKKMLAIGNCFATKEEAEMALEKVKELLLSLQGV